MSLATIQIELIKSCMEKILSSISMFQNYSLEKFEVQRVNTPTKITNYDFTFIALKYDRWLFVRIQDFFSHQKLIIWINQLQTKRNINIDIQNYFISQLNDRTIKGKLNFKSSTGKDLELAVGKIFKYVMDHSDDRLQEIIRGEAWVDMPFDWGDYK